jgi:putative FmdB family regulatory protein
MPIYEYECQDCGLRFEKLKSMSRCDEPEACPSCKVPEAKKLVSVVNHTFVFPASQMRGPAPPNTGTSIDYNADKVIGRDAEERRKVVAERSRRKDEIIRDARKAGLGVTSREQLVRTPANDYRVITETERKAANEGRALHQKALDAIKATTSPAPSPTRKS